MTNKQFKIGRAVVGLLWWVLLGGAAALIYFGYSWVALGLCTVGIIASWFDGFIRGATSAKRAMRDRAVDAIHRGIHKSNG